MEEQQKPLEEMVKEAPKSKPFRMKVTPLYGGRINRIDIAPGIVGFYRPRTYRGKASEYESDKQ